jgi:alkylhydroperoxidase/carboxymuconolactone decarboxylase family protein YurZ
VQVALLDRAQPHPVGRVVVRGKNDDNSDDTNSLITARTSRLLALYVAARLRREQCIERHVQRLAEPQTPD